MNPLQWTLLILAADIVFDVWLFRKIWKWHKHRHNILDGRE